MTEKTTELTITKALHKFQGLVTAMGYDKEVSTGSFKYKYVTLPSIIEAIKPMLKECELTFAQSAEDGHMITTIFHNSGSSYISKIPLPLPQGMTAQQLGSWITYARRYSLTTALGLVSEEDDDGSADSSNSYAEKASNKPAAKQSANMAPCPDCGKSMKEVNGKYGLFYSCSDYPKCNKSMKPDVYQQYKSSLNNAKHDEEYYDAGDR